MVFADRPDLAPAPPADARPRLWRASDLVAGVALVLAAMVLVVTGLLITGAAADSGAAAVLGTLAFEVLIGATVVLLALRRGLGPRALGLVRPHRWGPLGTAWVGSYLILIGYTMLLALLEALGVDVSRFTEGNPLPVDSADGAGLLVVLGIAVVVVAPLSEELFFRGLIFRGLRGFWARTPSLALSGLMFGAFHLNLGVLLPFTLIGVLFAWSNEESGSLWTSIVAHALVNGLSFALSLAGVGE